MSGARVMAIFQKDLRDAVRDSRLIVALAMPLLIGLLYSFMFEDETRPSVKLGVVSSVATTLPDALATATRQAVVLTIVSIPDEAGLTRQVKDEEVDIGVVVPAGFDRDLAAGRSPTLTVILPAAPTYGGDYMWRRSSIARRRRWRVSRLPRPSNASRCPSRPAPPKPPSRPSAPATSSC